MKQQDIDWLAGLTEKTVDACCVKPDNNPNSDVKVSEEVYRPGGRDCYPAIWVQDFTMIFSSGFLATKVGLEHLHLFLQCQNTEENKPLSSGAFIPPHAIPDHILFDGSPIFFPGTYSAEDQGGEPWGICPPYNNHFDVVWLAHMLFTNTRNSDFLLDEINGKTIYQRLKNAYEVPRHYPESGIVFTTEKERAVGIIFCDVVYMTGALLMASLLRIRASDQLSELAMAIGKEADAQYYASQAQLGRKNILPTFGGNDSEGWLRASTGHSSQPDVWGTIYSIFQKALPPDAERAALTTIVSALHDGTIEYQGALRHVPTNYDASANSAWERVNEQYNRYQNGAYWHMPTGWLVDILKDAHSDEAQSVMNRYITHMRQNDFTKGEAFGAPWECIGPEKEAYQNPVFAPSIVVPYSVWKK